MSTLQCMNSMNNNNVLLSSMDMYCKCNDMCTAQCIFDKYYECIVNIDQGYNILMHYYYLQTHINYVLNIFNKYKHVFINNDT